MAELKSNPTGKTEAAAPPALRPRREIGRHPFFDMRREMERLFDEFSTFGPFARGFEAFGGRNGDLISAPAIDVAETPEAFEITAELPGLDEKQVDLSLSNGLLTIKGEKKEESETKKKDYYVSERRYGSFERVLRVPEGVDADKAEATFKNGVLTVTLPKTASAKGPAKKIGIRAS